MLKIKRADVFVEVLIKYHDNLQLEYETNMKSLADDIMHKKNYIEALKNQLEAVRKEKAKYKQSFDETKADLQKRVDQAVFALLLVFIGFVALQSEQVSAEQAKKIEAERLANHLEITVEKRLDTIASRSEQALDKMQSQLTVSEDKNREYSVCVQVGTTFSEPSLALIILLIIIK